MTAPRVALIGFTAGASVACGIMAALAVRAVYTITTGHRWYQLKKL
ncbi:MAG: hypothetical protein M3536_10170 [Actinomycetota bacterium]|nr:hypothetical protein [Actinomycetota bacterium]